MVLIRLFAQLREASKAAEVIINFTGPQTFKSIITELISIKPLLKPILLENGKVAEGFQIIVNDQPWDLNTTTLLENTAKIAILPPIGGGTDINKFAKVINCYLFSSKYLSVKISWSYVKI